jgi:hypothetical protein
LRSGCSTTASRNVASSQSKKSGSQNATWDDFKRPSSALNIPTVGTTTSKKSRSSSRLRGASLQKSTSFTPPKRPERCFSPRRGDKMRISMKSNKSTKHQTIRNALGSMAPCSENALKRSSSKRSSRQSLKLSSKSDAQPLSRDLPPTLRSFKLLSSPTPDRGRQRNWAGEAIEGLELPDADALVEVC